MNRTSMDSRWWIPVLLGALLMFVWVWLGGLTAVYAPIVNLDINQHRANRSLPAPNGNFTVEQAFVSTHDGLKEVELLVVKRDEVEDNGREWLTVTLFDDTQAIIATQSFETINLRHNQPVTLQFPPQHDAAGRRYRLALSGTTDNVASVWGYDLDVYEAGQVTLVAGALATVSGETAVSPDIAAQDLRFITRYQLTWTEAFRVLWRILSQEWGLLLAAMLLLPIPGLIILLLGQRRWPSFDKAAWWGTAVALGIAIWPILWFLFSLMGGHWSGSLLWGVVIVGYLSVVICRFLFAARYFNSSVVQKITWHHLVLGLILLGGFAVRLLAIRDLAFPAWVDSSRHGLITAVMLRSGQTISNYAPFLPVERFPYHFGFHTLSASLALMLPQQQLAQQQLAQQQLTQLPQLLLVFGQLLNALVPLTVYTAVWLFTRHKGAGLFAAFLVTFPFFFPAYYATWGRYTQLSGMIVMPVLIALTWRLIRGGRRWQAVWWLVGILVAGLFLIHFRVFLIYLPFALIVWGMSLGRNGRFLLKAGLLTVILIGIRAVQLYELNKSLFSSSGSGILNYNAFPIGYYEAGWERYFVWLAAGLLIFLLTAVFRHRRWVALPLALLGWVGLLFILLAGKWLGLPEIGLINLNSMYITLFLPLAIYLATFLIQLQRLTRKMPQIVQIILYVAAGMGGMVGGAFGVHQQINILNPQTILATAADLEGLQWVDENLPQDANIAVNSWLWLGNTYAGQDGGAWIVQLTGRRSTTPPADYIYDRDLFEEVNGFNETAVSIPDWSTDEAADFLHQRAISHIFVGARGGFFDPAVLSRNAQLNLIYSANGVFIFELR